MPGTSISANSPPPTLHNNEANVQAPTAQRTEAHEAPAEHKEDIDPAALHSAAHQNAVGTPRGPKQGALQPTSNAHHALKQKAPDSHDCISKKRTGKFVQNSARATTEPGDAPGKSDLDGASQPTQGSSGAPGPDRTPHGADKPEATVKVKKDETWWEKNKPNSGNVGGAMIGGIAGLCAGIVVGSLIGLAIGSMPGAAVGAMAGAAIGTGIGIYLGGKWGRNADATGNQRAIKGENKGAVSSNTSDPTPANGNGWQGEVTIDREREQKGVTVDAQTPNSGSDQATSVDDNRQDSQSAQDNRRAHELADKEGASSKE